MTISTQPDRSPAPALPPFLWLWLVLYVINVPATISGWLGNWLRSKLANLR